MKKILLGLIIAVLAVNLYGCGAEKPIESSESSEPSFVGSSESSVPESSEPKEDKNLESIKVTYEDGGSSNDQQKMIVWIENVGDQVFTGDIHLTFYNGDNKKIGYDMAILEGLKPGEKQYCNIFVVPSELIQFKYDFSSSYKFEGDATESGAKVDNEKSKELSEMIKSSFGGDGNPEFATSWYKFIENLEIYSGESGYYAVVTISSDATDEAVDRISNSVLTNFNNPQLVKTVVNDADGKQVKEISK